MDHSALPQRILPHDFDAAFGLYDQETFLQTFTEHFFNDTPSHSSHFFFELLSTYVLDDHLVFLTLHQSNFSKIVD